ncbi:MAG: endonuclease III domain-containing protein [Candidatus Micrarchaeota archaeon]|nr:endonuclease III domain-containing protein [Candidatus Micrarchaeota archaeon]
MEKGSRILQIYHSLLEKYGTQGWWPIGGKYHPADYSFPKNGKQRFEICIGAILAQSISWKGAEKAVMNLRKAGLMDAGKLLRAPMPKLKSAIVPAGYFNQKARKLKEFARFYLALNGRAPSREELLSIWGIGKETADSILLYAYGVPTFVVDAYARRVFSGLRLVRRDADYDKIKQFFEGNLPKDAALFNEYHALIVRHAKEMKKKKAAN